LAIPLNFDFLIFGQGARWTGRGLCGENFKQHPADHTPSDEEDNQRNPLAYHL